MADHNPKPKRRLKVVRSPAEGDDLRRFFDEELETRVIGSIIRFGVPAYYSVRFLTPDDFTSEARKTVFTAIQQIGDQVVPVMGAIGKHLSETGKIGAAGGWSALADLHEKALDTDLSGFADSLRAKTIDRSAIALTKKLAELSKLGYSAVQADIRAVTEELTALRISGANGTSDIANLPGVGETKELITYIREPELPAGSIVALTGETECGKSTLLTSWCRDAIAKGHPVLYLDKENPRHVVQDRMERLGLKDCPKLRWWGLWCTKEVPDPSSDIVAAWVKSQTVAPIVVVDSLSPFHGGDQNDAALMRQFIDPLRRLASMGAVVVILHHVGADSNRPYRGSSDFGPAIDQGFVVANSSENRLLDRVRLKPFKSRYGLCEDIIYRYATGRFIRDGRTTAPAETAGQQLTALLRTNPGVQTKQFEDLAAKHKLGRNRARGFLSTSVRTGSVRRENAGRNKFKHYLAEGTSE